MQPGKFDRRIQFRRYVVTDDGYSSVETWQNEGQAIWASRRDVSDGEKAANGSVFAEISARFVVRSDTFTRSITPKDRLIEEGQEFDIIGLKQLGRRDYLEITAVAASDG